MEVWLQPNAYAELDTPNFVLGTVSHSSPIAARTFCFTTGTSCLVCAQTRPGYASKPNERAATTHGSSGKDYRLNSQTHQFRVAYYRFRELAGKTQTQKTKLRLRPVSFSNSLLPIPGISQEDSNSQSKLKVTVNHNQQSPIGIASNQQLPTASLPTGQQRIVQD